MNTHTKPTFRFGMMIAGMIFLCNPNINLLDPLPDFIGYLLLAFSLSDAAEALPHFEEARTGFIKLAWISLSKIPASAMMMFVWSSDRSQGSIITVFSLCYAVVTLMYLLPTVSHFFEGIFYMGQRHDCPSALQVPAVFGKISADGFRKLTLGFLILKEVMSTLPEFSLISVRQYDPDLVFSGSRFIASNYYPLFLLIGASIVLICGVIWVSMMAQYLRFLRADGHADALLCGYFADKADYLKRKRRAVRICSALTLLTVAAGFSIDLVFDDLNVLPDVIAALLLMLALFLLRTESRRALPACVMCGIYGGVNLWAYVLKCIFIARFEYRDIALYEEAKQLYDLYTVVSAASFLTFLLALVAVCMALSDLFRCFAPAEEETGKRFAGAKRIVLAFGLVGGISELASLVDVFANSHTKSVAVDGQATFFTIPTWEWYWMIPLLLSLSWLLYTYFITEKLRVRVTDTVDE